MFHHTILTCQPLRPPPPLAQGMAHLHSARVGPNGRPIIHGDLKAVRLLPQTRRPSRRLSLHYRLLTLWRIPHFLHAQANVLVCLGGQWDTLRFVPKISDFGFSRIHGEMSSLASGGSASGRCAQRLSRASIDFSCVP